MSVQHFRDSLGKLIKDFPLQLKLPALVEDPSVVKYVEVNHASWLIAYTKEMCLHLSLFLYELMKQYSTHVGVDLFQGSENLLSFIKKFLADGCCSENTLWQSDVTGIGEFFGSMVDATRKWTTLYSKKCTNLWTFMKDFAQTRTIQVNNDAYCGVQNMFKNTAKLASSQVDILTREFLVKSEKVIAAMSDACKNNQILEATRQLTGKLTGLADFILKLIDNFLDYISSLTAFDFDIPFEMDWVQIEDGDELALLLNVVEFVGFRKKRRYVGQH